MHKDGYRSRFVSGLRVASGATLARDVVLVATDGGAQNELDGIGAGIQRRDEGVFVGSVFPGGPAEKSGVRAGNGVVSIDGEPADGMSAADAMQRLRGERGTPVGVTVARPSGDTADVIIVRGAIVY